MECKLSCARLTLRERETELIDTLWNVNAVAQKEETAKKVELIDTLWNVNAFLTNSHALFIMN